MAATTTSSVAISGAGKPFIKITSAVHTAELILTGPILKGDYLMRTYEESKLISDLYASNDDMKDYVERYALCRHISIDEALSHEVVLQKAIDIQYRLHMNVMC